MLKVLKYIAEVSGFIGLPTCFGYYLGKETGRAIYNFIIGLSISTYQNITQNLPYKLPEVYIIEKISQSGLDKLLENTFAFTFGGLLFASGTYLYLKYKLKDYI